MAFTTTDLRNGGMMQPKKSSGAKSKSALWLKVLRLARKGGLTPAAAVRFADLALKFVLDVSATENSLVYPLGGSALVGVGNPQGNLNHVNEHRDFYGVDSQVGAMIDLWLKTGDANLAMAIANLAEQESCFWGAIAGKAVAPKPAVASDDGHDEDVINDKPNAEDLNYRPSTGDNENCAKCAHCVKGKCEITGKALSADESAKNVCDVFDLEESGDKEEIAAMSFDYVIKGLVPDDERITYGIVYRHSRADHQREWADQSLVAKAAHRYVTHYRKNDDEHSFQEGAGEVVESYLAPMTITHFFGKALDPIDQPHEGDWVLAVRWSPQEWNLIKTGQRTGYSLGGLKKILPGIMPPDLTPPHPL